MKTIKTFFAASCIAIASLAGSTLVSASETSSASSEKLNEDSTSLITWGVNADLVSKYIWRGSIGAKTPGIQPGLKATIKGFTLGAWGSYHFIDDYTETDIYASYSLPFGLSLTVNDYFWYTTPDPVSNTPVYAGDYFDYKKTHYIEGLVGFAVPKTGLTISGGKMLYGANDKSIYTEAAYQFSAFKVLVGAGNEMFTSDGKFKVCNIGLSSSKSVHFSDKFEMPITASFIVNPDKKQAHLVFMFSF